MEARLVDIRGYLRRPRRRTPSESDFRKHRHQALNRLVRRGVPGAFEARRRFRQAWANEMRRREEAAGSWEECERWGRMASYWSLLAGERE